MTHFFKLLEAFRGFSLHEMLSSVPTGTSCPGSDRRHGDGDLHQSAGGHVPPPITLLARRLILWSSDCFLSLQATHVPGL